MHDELPDKEKVPAVQLLHDGEPDEFENVPAAHAVHATPENPALQAVANAVDDAVSDDVNDAVEKIVAESVSEADTDEVAAKLTDELTVNVGK